MKQYSLEFKNQLIKEATETKNVAMVARKHSLSKPTLYAWVRKARQPKGEARAVARMDELEKKLKSSQLENEILKELLKKTNLAWLGDSKLQESSLRSGGTQ